jgi:hypothetical protein
MTYRLSLLLTSVVFISSTWGSLPRSTPQSYEGQRKQALNLQINQEDEDTRESLKKRADARVLQERAQYGVDASNQISKLLEKLPLSVKEHPASTVATVVNKLALGVSLGVRALGRWREAAQQILSTNEQVLEASIKSYEKIESLSATLKEMLGPKTVIYAFKELPSSEKSNGEKILDLLRPRNYINTFTKFTDATYLTKKADRWEQVKKTADTLRDEEKRFDDYIAMLQVKILERQIMNLHKLENFAGSKTSSATQVPGYQEKLVERIAVIKAAIDANDKKIRALSGIQSQTGGITNRLKKVVGKDDESQRTKELTKLNTEKAQYVKQLSEVQAEQESLASSSMTSEEIKTERELLKGMIEEIKGRRVAGLSVEELGDAINDMQKQITSLQNQLNALKVQPRAVPPLPARAGRPRQAAS